MNRENMRKNGKILKIDQHKNQEYQDACPLQKISSFRVENFV